ncbi:hypothetical protein QCA50_007542 [Cerrena zonata]|uniref:Vomeronasal type-1 receptor n=1 Tax=Cerrena zonata TaxID=2478898 RepID=A0AAW0G5C1_9APHY
MCRGDMESNLLGTLSNIIFAIHIFCSVVAQWGILSIKSVNLFDSFPTKSGRALPRKFFCTATYTNGRNPPRS